MKAMILAAGQGTRLRPLTEGIPKCMIPIGGRPILEHTVAWFARHDVRDIMINLYFMPQVVIDHFGDGSRWGVNITYSIEQEALGTAGGVKNVAWFFDNAGDSRKRAPFVVWYGDNLSYCDLDRMLRFHACNGGLVTMALFYREDVSQSGIVALDDDDRILGFLEKPRPEQVFSHWVNAGILILEPVVLQFIPSGRQDFSFDVLPALLAADRRLYGYRLSESEGLWWIDTPADLARVQAEWKGGEEAL
jgi:NDP-sugar pyrophosphorylase family protein